MPKNTRCCGFLLGCYNLLKTGRICMSGILGNVLQNAVLRPVELFYDMFYRI